jgi:predicted hydrocarbon binding protein
MKNEHKSRLTLFLLSLIFAALLSAALYAVAYTLVWHAQGVAQRLGYTIGVLLTFPVIMLFGPDRELSILAIIMIGAYDVLIFGLPIFVLVDWRRRKLVNH